jgi:dihydrolipoamide dehydrogenase
MSNDSTFDVVVVGSGPGGYIGAIRAAQLGLKAAVVEKAELGGICLNWGCIPTKALLRSAEVLLLARRAAAFGVTAQDVGFDYAAVVRRSRDIAARLSAGVGILLKKNHVQVFQGSATVKGPGLVSVQTAAGQQTDISTRFILVATGSRSRQIPGLETDAQTLITSREALVLDRPPPSIAIVGAGAIGVEFAHLFHSFGSDVTLLEMLPSVLPQADEEISHELERSFRKRKMKVLTAARITGIEKKAASVTLLVEQKGKQLALDVSTVLMATGVVGNVEGCGLAEIGVTVERGFIKTDPAYRTSVPGIYAIGDVIGNPCLAHVASAEAIKAVEHMAGHPVVPLDYLAVPACVYCSPQVASVGHTEKSAAAAGIQCRVGRFPLRASDRVIGCHIIGPEATELITEVALGLTTRAGFHHFEQTVHPHPTLSEAVAEAAAAAYTGSLNA